MHIYGVFKEDNSAFGVLCGRGMFSDPALYGNEESAIEWAIHLGNSHPRCAYVVYKFNLNPNGFTAERVYSPPAAGDSIGLRWSENIA